ncbi:MAG: ABC transporter ATP-binding protein [Magnetovibrio sp.]|nr:ABC transporter ATP-binding protein [Magnetovibrio sp.]
MLKIENLNAWYDRSHIIQGVSLHVNKGEIVSIIGRNGAGKTTTLRSVMGLIDKRKGSVCFNGGDDMLMEPTHTRFRHGLAFVPEDRRIVAGLTVRENLRLGLLASDKKNQENEVIERISVTFPRLKERLDQVAETMSGGEQQMLAVARALARDVKLLILDEPYEGLAPVIVHEIERILMEIRKLGITTIIVEQNAVAALQLADKALILDMGKIAFRGTAKEVLEDKELRHEYLAI